MVPMVFALADNPVVRGEVDDHPLCHWHAAVFERLFRALIAPQTRVVETDLTSLLDQFGICQRIRSTPLPTAYVIQLRTALAILLVLFPLGVVSHLLWYTPLTMFVVSYVLIGVEQIGTELEDPFEFTTNDVDLRGISARIESDLLALCADETPRVEPPSGEERASDVE